MSRLTAAAQKKVNRHVLKALVVLCGETEHKAISAERIFCQVSYQIRNLVPVPDLPVAIEIALNNLSREGVIKSCGKDGFAVGRLYGLPDSHETKCGWKRSRENFEHEDETLAPPNHKRRNIKRKDYECHDNGIEDDEKDGKQSAGGESEGKELMTELMDNDSSLELRKCKNYLGAPWRNQYNVEHDNEESETHEMGDEGDVENVRLPLLNAKRHVAKQSRKKSYKPRGPRFKRLLNSCPFRYNDVSSSTSMIDLAKLIAQNKNNNNNNKNNEALDDDIEISNDIDSIGSKESSQELNAKQLLSHKEEGHYGDEEQIENGQDDKKPNVEQSSSKTETEPKTNEESKNEENQKKAEEEGSDAAYMRTPYTPYNLHPYQSYFS